MLYKCLKGLYQCLGSSSSRFTVFLSKEEFSNDFLLLIISYAPTLWTIQSLMEIFNMLFFRFVFWEQKMCFFNSFWLIFCGFRIRSTGLYFVLCTYIYISYPWDSIILVSPAIPSPPWISAEPGQYSASRIYLTNF